MNHAENFGAKWCGYNYRITEIHACIAWHGLIALEGRNRVRQNLADALPRFIRGGHGLLSVCPHRGYPDCDHVYYVLPILVLEGNRSRIAKRLRARGVEVGEGYINPPLHQYPAFRKYARGRLPVVERLSAEQLLILTQVRPPASYEDMDYLRHALEYSVK